MKLGPFEITLAPSSDALTVMRQQHDAWWQYFALLCAEAGHKELAQGICNAHLPQKGKL